MSRVNPSRWTGDHLRALRQKLGLSQEVFAALTCVTDGSVQRWEAAHDKPAVVGTGLARVALTVLDGKADIARDPAALGAKLTAEFQRHGRLGALYAILRMQFEGWDPSA